jgi:uncharacterized protein YjbI with pentapeptide repeats
MITEAILDQAIEAAEAGHLNGLTYNQSNWCGTACCVLGFARHIAGIEEIDAGPQEGEIENTPRARAIERLMRCGSPWILRIMRRVDAQGKIDLRDAYLSDAYLSGADLSGAEQNEKRVTEEWLREQGAIL